MNTEAVWTFISTQGVDFGLKILAALAAWVVGRWLIGWVVRLLGAGFRRGGKIDQTLANFLPLAKCRTHARSSVPMNLV